MPLFLKHKVLFIHIPKCGGTTFASRLEAAGDPPFMQVVDGSVMVNGHTPQHLTWRELVRMGWITPPGFRVVALVRHPQDRVASAYRWVRVYRPDLARYTRSPRVFLKNFFSRNPARFAKFDQHNLGLLDFVCDAHGTIPPDIELWPLAQIDALLHSLGLPPVATQDRHYVTSGDDPFSPGQWSKIRQRLERDIAWYEDRFAPESTVDEARSSARLDVAPDPSRHSGGVRPR